MPYLGLSSFLRLDGTDLETDIAYCFNALPRAFFFSTEEKYVRKGKQHTVSMPYLGLSSFLLHYILRKVLYTKHVSMPYLGLSSFLHRVRAKEALIYGTVSMPYLGLSSFLRYVSASLEFTGFANPFLRVII